jgi:hypothetical protein
MKKSKNIKQFKQALLSNAEFIKQTNEEKPETNNQQLQENIINDEIFKKFELLAAFDGIDTKTLINNALNHFLRLKGAQLELAQKQNKNNNK